jgi:hypothetical protein
MLGLDRGITPGRRSDHTTSMWFGEGIGRASLCAVQHFAPYTARITHACPGDGKLDVKVGYHARNRYFIL